MIHPNGSAQHVSA